MRDRPIFTEGDPFDVLPPVDRSPVITEDHIDHAMDLVVATQIASIDLLQERMRVSYLKAVRLMDILETIGVVGPELVAKQRRYDSVPQRRVVATSRVAISAATACLQARARREDS